MESGYQEIKKYQREFSELKEKRMVQKVVIQGDSVGVWLKKAIPSRLTEYKKINYCEIIQRENCLLFLGMQYSPKKCAGENFFERRVDEFILQTLLNEIQGHADPGPPIVWGR